MYDSGLERDEIRSLRDAIGEISLALPELRIRYIGRTEECLSKDMIISADRFVNMTNRINGNRREVFVDANDLAERIGRVKWLTGQNVDVLFTSEELAIQHGKGPAVRTYGRSIGRTTVQSVIPYRRPTYNAGEKDKMIRFTLARELGFILGAFNKRTINVKWKPEPYCSNGNCVMGKAFGFSDALKLAKVSDEAHSIYCEDCLRAIRQNIISSV